MILKPTLKFINYIEQSIHYLNCPTHMFNESLHSLYRQGVHNNTSVKNIIVMLEMYNYPKPNITAYWLVNQYKTISIKDFNKLNVNAYTYLKISELPEHIQRFDKRLTTYFEENKEYYWNGVYKGTKSYPFKKN